MHFIILIPIILLFKLILWLLGLTIVVSGLKAFGEFIYRYKHIFIPLVVLSVGYFVYNIISNVPDASETQQYSYVEPPKFEPNYKKELNHHSERCYKIIKIESLEVVSKNGEEVQFKISLKNKTNNPITNYMGKLMIWDKNNKFVGEYDFSEFDGDPAHSASTQSGWRYDSEKQKYIEIKESDSWIFPNKKISFEFAYLDESVKNYNFKNFKYVVLFNNIKFRNKTEYFCR
jgi:hypothetical protein